MSDSSKQAILKGIRANLLEAAELPNLRESWIRYDDPAAQFAEVLRMVGGRAVRVAGAELLPAELQAIDSFTSARQVCSLVDAVPGNVDLDAIDDPHHLETVDFAIARGEFCVAENGAVWVTDAAIRHRVVLFIAQHLALVVPSNAIVHNLHEAYERLAFGDRGFGVFISGPSKTADIEQSLVIGAHGARSLTVFLVD